MANKINNLKRCNKNKEDAKWMFASQQETLNCFLVGSREQTPRIK